MNNNLSDNLKKIRKDNNLSQEQLADELGVSRQAISKWESGAAYPEMEKLVQICQKFDVNIDDLLNKDIREVKGEEESRKSINKYIDDFLNFVSDTVNLFSSMSFKSKIKCLLEQCILVLILCIIFGIMGAILDNVTHSILSAFGNISYRINDILSGIYLIFALIVSSIILIHVFKTRYLDYFVGIKKSVDDNIENDDTLLCEDNHKNKRIVFNRENDKIIIRDPKHSEYRFINGFVKVIVLFIKFFALLFALSLCFCLICFLAIFTISFLFIKTGFLFIGFVLGMLCLSVGTVIIILLLFNFIFNRKNDKKKMIISFISAIIVFGFSCGLMFIGSLNFDVKEYDDKSLVVTKKMELDMNNDLIISSVSQDVFVEKDIDNVVIEYDINKFFTLNFDYSHYYGAQNIVHFYSRCSNPMDALRFVLEEFNNHKIVSMNGDFYNVKVYANRDNIAKIKNNNLKYENDIKVREEATEYYNDKIDELNNLIDEKNETISELNDELEEKKNEINELQYELNQSDCD